MKSNKKYFNRNPIETNRGAIELGSFFQSMKIVAPKLGIDPSHLSLLISGKRKPSIEIAAKIEKIFNIPCIYWTESISILPKIKDKE